MPGQQSIQDYQTRLSNLERDLANVMEENRKLKKELEQKFGCFKCGDGATPLYCLNCANEVSAG